jgi:hypothetical protein
MIDWPLSGIGAVAMLPLCDFHAARCPSIDFIFQPYLRLTIRIASRLKAVRIEPIRISDHDSENRLAFGNLVFREGIPLLRILPIMAQGSLLSLSAAGWIHSVCH